MYEKYTTSNYGLTSVDLFAPGDAILSCYPIECCSNCITDGNQSHESEGYHYLTGTSMATPYVTGVAALIKSLNPSLEPDEIKATILLNVDPIESLNGLCLTGGLLNAHKAICDTIEAQTFTGDVNGDGQEDMILSRVIGDKRALTTFLGNSDGKFSYPITTQSSWNFIMQDSAYSGDFNGDDRIDILIHWSNNDGKRQLLIYLGNIDGTFSEGVNWNSTRYHDPVAYPYSAFVADINGDGKDDFIIHYRHDNGKRYSIVYKGSSTSPYMIDATTNALESTNNYVATDPVFVGDFNGDGYDDLLVHWANSSEKRQLLLYKGTANATFETGVTLSSTRNHKASIFTKFLVSDVNGDGKDDFVVHWKNSAGKRNNLVYLGTNSPPYLIDATTNALTSTNSYREEDPVLVGDFNGDGYEDMIVYWNSNDEIQLLLYTSKGNSTYNLGINYPSEQCYTISSCYVMDVNDDGCDDFVVKWRDQYYVGIYTYLGNSLGSFTEGIQSIHYVLIPYCIH